ncbi:hypothetical protein AB1Y20_001122 [Prymnesium parvum]|uniref:Aminotransferase class V domain-containing protein n=1 Tax=Prymnesium parvum TaxID=97485 RepID=A0AB34KAI8_PRYPA
MISVARGAAVAAAALGVAAWLLHARRHRRRGGVGSPLPRAREHGACIYLDYQATTPVFPEVAAAAEPFLRLHWGNPSSGHAFGRTSAAAVVRARAHCAALLSAHADEILFTSCGSEADNHAIVGALVREEARRRAEGDEGLALPHLVTSVVEHPAVVECVRALQAAGRLRVTWVGVDATGRVDAREVALAVEPTTVLVSVMHSNNEVGALQPVAEIARLVRTCSLRPDVLLHTDAAQSAGKLRLDVRELGVDLLTLVGHKFGAPKGVGALYVRRGVALPSLLHGGGQEGGRRAGTESVLLLVAMGEAARLAVDELDSLRAHMSATRERLAARLQAGLPAGAVRIHGPAEPSARLPNTLSVGIEGVRAAELLARLQERVAASAGAACHSGGAVSAVLKAMGVPLEVAVGTLRLSTGRHTTMEEVERAADEIIAEARRQLGV